MAFKHLNSACQPFHKTSNKSKTGNTNAENCNSYRSALFNLMDKGCPKISTLMKKATDNKNIVRKNPGILYNY